MNHGSKLARYFASTQLYFNLSALYSFVTVFSQVRVLWSVVVVSINIANANKNEKLTEVEKELSHSV